MLHLAAIGKIFDFLGKSSNFHHHLNDIPHVWKPFEGIRL